MMPIRRWIFPLTAAAAFSQEAPPFPEEAPAPWRPAWELTLREDQLTGQDDRLERFSRTGLQLRLRWSWNLGVLRLEAGTRSATGSDGNQFNAARWDNLPSNGTQVDVARTAFSWVRDRSFGALSLGFQENGLMASQALWDRNIRYLGVGGMVGRRSTSGFLEEASLRAAAGRIRTLLGGQVDLAAGQAVLKLDTGPWSWAAHISRWSLSWDPGRYRLRPLAGGIPQERQRMVVDAVGASGRWHAIFPWEVRWFGSRNTETRETSEEAQVMAGSRERVYWPQVSFTWQRLSFTGTLYPVNGDEWWIYRGARGPRLDASLPLPGQWIATFSFIRQRPDGGNPPVIRKMLVLVKRF